MEEKGNIQNSKNIVSESILIANNQHIGDNYNLHIHLNSEFVKPNSEVSFEYPLIQKRKYLPIKDYIPRKLLKQDRVNEYQQHNVDTSLIELFENSDKPLKITLKSIAGDGKTSELKQLAHHFSLIDSPNSLFPILIRLKDYINEDLYDLLPKYCRDWENINQKRLLIIFDGYDEVKDTVKDDLNKRISRLANTHPLINIVVSSRNNGIQQEIEQFDIYFLQKLSYYGEVYQYVYNKLQDRTETFNQLIHYNKLHDLLLTPFYLVKLTQLYDESPDSFPNNRIEVFDKIIDLINREEIDSNRILADDWEEMEFIQDSLLCRLANTMLLMGKNIFNSKEYREIIGNKKDREIIEKSPLLSKKRGNIEFTHNLFQEYLTAKILSKQAFETIKKCISFEPDFVKIKPKWTNTLSSLFSLLPEESDTFKKLLGFILESDHSLLIRFESAKISLPLRFKIFKSILESPYKNYENYSHNELIAFAGIYENKEVIEYLLENINPQNQKQTRELTYLLKYASPSELFGLEKEIETVLKTVLSDKNYDDEIHEDVLWTFSHLELSNPELIEWLMIHKPSFTFKNILCVVFKLINDLDIVDKYIDFYLESIPICNEELVKNGVRRTTGVKDYFYKGIFKVKSTNSLHKILDYIIKNYDELERRSKIFCEEDFKGEFSTKLFAQLTKGYKSDKKLFDKVAKLVEKKLYDSYNRDFIDKVKPFFEETETTEKAYWYLWDNKKNREIRWYIRSTFSCWINKSIVDKWVKRYEKKYYSDIDVADFKRDLFINRQENLLQYFLKEINAVSEVVHEYPVFITDDYEKKENERRNNDLELLLNKSKFLEIVTQILEILGKGFSKENLTDLEYNDRPFNCHLPYNYIHFYLEGKKKITDYSIIFSDISDDGKWNGYVITELRRRIKDKEDSPSLPDAHIKYIKDWCYTLLPSLNFKTAKWNINGQEWWRSPEEYFAFFFRHLQLEIPQETMLDMLLFDSRGLYDWKETEHHKIPPVSDIVIQRVNNDELIKQCILENLNRGIEVLGVLGNHFRLCRKLKIYDAKPYILNTIKANIFDTFQANTLIDIYVELKGEINDFEFRLKGFDSSKEAHWYILEKLSTIEKNIPKINDIVEIYLNNNVDISDDNRLKAMNQLILNGHTLGLQEFKDFGYPKYHSYESKRFISFAKIPFDKAFPIWEEILQMSIKINQKLDRFHRSDLQTLIFEIFKLYSLKNEIHFYQIKEMVSKYIQRDNDDFWYLNRRIDHLENEFYTNKIDIPTVAKARLFCEEIGLQY